MLTRHQILTFWAKLAAMAAENAPHVAVTDPHRVAELIYRYIRKPITKKQRDELDEWVGQSDDHMLLFEVLTDDMFQEAIVLNKPLVEAFMKRWK